MTKLIILQNDYHQIDTLLLENESVTEVMIADHLCGFDCHYQNWILEKIESFAAILQRRITVCTSYVLESYIKEKYQWLDFEFLIYDSYEAFHGCNTHPELSFQNFICCFNGSDHVSRKLLVALLYRFGWFNAETCSKNFSFSIDAIDGHIKDYVGDANQYYLKFFIGDDSGTTSFFERIYSFGHNRFDHAENIHTLQIPICKSFLHLISETMATSYYPMITEKVFYSIVSRGLYLAWAPVHWHSHLENHFGFKKYDKIFDYRFDTIENPVERIIELISMIAKFSILSTDDWRDLYQTELDTIEYNYDHYFSQNYLKKLSEIDTRT